MQVDISRTGPLVGPVFLQFNAIEKETEVGKTWGSARSEGCVDDIGNARMGKRRRMRWSSKVAHNVAVPGAAVLDGR